MKYTVHIRHFAAGRFWEDGDEREADPVEVAPQVQRGVLVPVQAEAEPEAEVEPEPKAKGSRKSSAAAE